MIERGFVAQKTKEYYIKRYIESKLDKVGISSIKLKKIPLGEKIIIETSRPSLIVGSKGSNIKELTKVLKVQFKLENPQVEINEVKNIFLDPAIVAERIASSLERFGSARFKGVGHKVMGNVMNSGALGVEIIISGKIPSARARNWRFYQGYLKKCGDISISGVKKARRTALLKSGIIGIKVAIMPADLKLPDHIEVLDEPVEVVEEIIESKDNKKTKVAKKKTAKKKTAKKKVVKKTVAVVEEKKIEEVKEEKQEKTKVEETPVEKNQEVQEEKETVTADDAEKVNVEEVNKKPEPSEQVEENQEK
jgi:small subunit ribosomal protein S3